MHVFSIVSCNHPLPFRLVNAYGRDAMHRYHFLRQSKSTDSCVKYSLIPFTDMWQLFQTQYQYIFLSNGVYILILCHFASLRTSSGLHLLPSLPVMHPSLVSPPSDWQSHFCSWLAKSASGNHLHAMFWLYHSYRLTSHCIFMITSNFENAWYSHR